jgi:formylglycine-generating enzyme required for sulfatase activity
MHGNVWEWCSDKYRSDAYRDFGGGVTDPQGPAEGDQSLDGQERRVARGGSWVDLPRLCRSASRLGLPPAHRFFSVGFRIARNP